MSVYMTEEEQVELIKSWWKKYSSVIIVSLSVVLLTLSGIKYWQVHKETNLGKASSTYEHMMVSFANKDYKSVEIYSKILIYKHKKTVYADAARLTLAKNAVIHEQYKTAKKLLETVADKSKSKIMADVARIRLARILIQEKLYTDAISQLNRVVDTSYLAIVNELKGDIAVTTGKKENAIAYYKKAIGEIDKNGVGNTFLEMKSNKLLSETKAGKSFS